MTTLDSLKDRYQDVRERCAEAARRSGRDPASIMLVAVSKYAGIDDVRELITMGHRDFGENLVPSLVQRAAMIDEWQARQKALPRTKASAPAHPLAAAPGTPVRWHMIGHLQRNKVKKAVELSRLIHSVDSLRLAEEVQVAANKLAKTAEVLVQVNTSGEASKFGCAPAAASHLVEAIETMINVRVRGLMTMAPHEEGGAGARGGGDRVRGTFARCRELFSEMRRQGLGGDAFNILSMGMSEDYPLAIAEGANLVRVGSAIFGPPTAGMDQGEEIDRETDDDGGED